ncbi:Tetratricopeptide repeat-containing protein [Muriicola jejuensis]|uniref:Tetratricopeptide repeat protein n=1 Tax=Muriicola jejuensis TaxID=504488 RepID=A0A6P0UF10_9FLAO|nr:tetratricopeptide repeat protein [Muriicola jejuensis]NER11597.1 tetratricopeptide repeat protein [Muriicola jejuensis]SMP19380.1 Tetratricopeptide repeat-containing protein [Muriicola jejuensis]
MNAKKFLFLTFLGFQLATGQQLMDQGFKLLESGDFDQARNFFDAYLQNDPTNKTALICYGRAVGLSGEPGKAIAHFGELKQQYPEDFEITVNLNEAHLWAGEFDTARPLYEDLVRSNPNSFVALLGYANTLSNLKEYTGALAWIEKAIALDTASISAKVSRKYIRLGYADRLIKEKNYGMAEDFLQENLLDFPSDRESLISLANMYLIQKEIGKAEEAYSSLATTRLDTIRALNGLSLASHLDHRNRHALTLATDALRKAEAIDDKTLKEQTRERFVQALIWNSQYRRAGKQIDSLEQVLPQQLWVKALRATLGMYTAKFNESLNEYDDILCIDSTAFDGNLGKANALFASDRIIPAYRAAFTTLSVYEGQVDAQGLVEKINGMHTPAIEDKAFFSFDNGNNVAFGNQVSTDIPFSTKFRTTLSYLYRNTENTTTSNKALTHTVLAGITYKLMPNTRLKAVAGFNVASFTGRQYTQPIVDLRFQLKSGRLQNLEVGYQRGVQNFNADLIEREIVMNHLGLNYNLGTTFNLGWYTQAMHTQQTDGNTRNLIFSSLYYNLTKLPAVKLGINYQYISFSDQFPSIYFSPESYQALEIFGDVRGSFSEKSSYYFNGAAGTQRVEDDDPSAVFRVEAGFRQQFSKRLWMELYGKYSNIASATATGFEFTELGVKIRWNLTELPLYYKKLLAQLKD